MVRYSWFTWESTRARSQWICKAFGRVMRIWEIRQAISDCDANALTSNANLRRVIGVVWRWGCTPFPGRRVACGGFLSSVAGCGEPTHSHAWFLKSWAKGYRYRTALWDSKALSASSGMEEELYWISHRFWNRIDGCLCRAVSGIRVSPWKYGGDSWWICASWKYCRYLPARPRISTTSGFLWYRSGLDSCV